MQKNLIILGESGSGKSRLATNIAGEKAFIINHPSLSSRRSLTEQIERALSMSDIDPEVIIIEDVRSFLYLGELIKMATIGVHINRKGQSPKTITPKSIIICEEQVKPGEWCTPTLREHYDIIYLKNIR